MPDLHPFIQELLRIEPPKTWSLIATMFGDLDGDHLSGKQIGMLLANAGIKPEASRVALHRLRNDGWIVSQKTGREVSYALSDQGRAETFAAQEDVYRQDVKYAGGWQVFALDPEKGEPDGGHLALSRNLILAPKGTSVPRAFALSFTNDALPAWVEGRLVPPHLQQQAGKLADLAKHYSDIEAQLSPTDVTTIRLLFIHYWRRMALRSGAWAHIGMFPEGDLARCHRLVTSLMSQTKRLSPPAV